MFRQLQRRQLNWNLKNHQNQQPPMLLSIILSEPMKYANGFGAWYELTNTMSCKTLKVSNVWNFLQLNKHVNNWGKEMQANETSPKADWIWTVRKKLTEKGAKKWSGYAHFIDNPVAQATAHPTILFWESTSWTMVWHLCKLPKCIVGSTYERDNMGISAQCVSQYI